MTKSTEHYNHLDKPSATFPPIFPIGEQTKRNRQKKKRIKIETRNPSAVVIEEIDDDAEKQEHEIK